MRSMAEHVFMLVSSSQTNIRDTLSLEHAVDCCRSSGKKWRSEPPCINAFILNPLVSHCASVQSNVYVVEGVPYRTDVIKLLIIKKKGGKHSQVHSWGNMLQNLARSLHFKIKSPTLRTIQLHLLDCTAKLKQGWTKSTEAKQNMTASYVIAGKEVAVTLKASVYFAGKWKRRMHMPTTLAPKDGALIAAVWNWGRLLHIPYEWTIISGAIFRLRATGYLRVAN